MRRLPDTRILMTTDAVGGVWTFVTGLASALAALGADIHLVTMGPRPRADQRDMLSESPVRLIETDLALEWQDPEGIDLGHARNVLTSLTRDIRPDLIHLNSYREATFDWPAPVLVTAHSCVNSWALACNDVTWLSQPRWRRYTEHVKAGLDEADAWVAPTRAFRDVMDDLYRPRSKGRVVWNASGIADAMPDKEPFILAAGRMWDTAKNLAVLSAAAAGVDWPIVVAGGASDEPPNPAGGITLTGELPHEELGTLMQRAAIFVSPARYEPFGLSVLEAASAGCALVLSDIPTFRELWDGCASFVSPDDIGGLRVASNDLCANAPKREQFRQAATARARRYTTSRMVDGYARLYRSLIPPAKAPCAVEVCA
jgi:glycosyltransferase involved in cell wall biosynthesis